MAHPLIIFVPGLLPKPEPAKHHEALLRCLLAGLRRVDAPVANAVAATPGGFDNVSWTYDFYLKHRDIELDSEAIEAVIGQGQASVRDIAEASAWRRRLARRVYALGDMLPFLIPHLASERIAMHLRDLRRYERNKDGIGEHIRRMLKVPLLAAAGGGHPVLLIAHSMGSIIAYDALWELGHCDGNAVDIDLLLTMGSPLGQRFMQRKIKGHAESGAARYPGNIKRWKNLTAVGDLTAINPNLANDFSEMLELGLLEAIEDEELLNFFRDDGQLNVHSEYGYLVNDKTALTIAKWWRGHDVDLPAATQAADSA